MLVVSAGEVRPRVLPTAPAGRLLTSASEAVAAGSTPRTVNCSWQVPGEPAGIAPPVRVTLLAVKPAVLPQVLETTPVTCRLEGRLSVKLVSGMLYALLGLLSVMVAVRERPWVSVAPPRFLDTVGFLSSVTDTLCVAAETAAGERSPGLMTLSQMSPPS